MNKKFEETVDKKLFDQNFSIVKDSIHCVRSNLEELDTGEKYI